MQYGVCGSGTCPQGLVDVDLSGNQITLEGLRGLAEGIASSATLAAIVLDNNDLRTEGGKELLHAVDRNKGIVVCSMENTNTSDQIRMAMEALLEPRRKLRDKLHAQQQQQQQQQQQHQ
ncbi:hypothetical protein Vafri_2957 [Volvox africanus]|uniref:Uncharacterized protein n=1 Tax=Volvox africanus TaxID=51714 RepID=A0A8J4AQI1_9CHLO|nr:hypothetical protein Vafri_2957 [Volvox africanus]